MEAGSDVLGPGLSRIARTLRERPYPTRFAVEVCAECNLACTMCHHPFMRRPKGTMPFELWRRCADQLATMSPETQCWFSFCGEPLLQPERLLEMIRYGRSVGLRSLNINTNGMLCTPEVAEAIVESDADLIVFGIDGFTPETFERIRVGAVREVVYRNVEHLLELERERGRGPGIQVQFIEMDENEHELERFSHYWLARGATLKVRHKLSWGGTFETPLCVPVDDRIPCPWAMTMMHVFWDGRVPRCPGDTEGEDFVGNAWDEPLSQLWARLGTYRHLHMERRFDDLPERCHACRDWMTGAARRVRPRRELVASMQGRR